MEIDIHKKWLTQDRGCARGQSERIKKIDFDFDINSLSNFFSIDDTESISKNRNQFLFPNLWRITDQRE